MNSTRIVEVALPIPTAAPYLYAVPEGMADRALPGARVVVPVRSREMIGVITAVDAAAPAGVQLREVLAVPDTLPSLDSPMLELAAEMSRSYGVPLGMVIRAMLPALLWGRTEVLVTAVDHATAVGGTGGKLLDWLRRRGGDVKAATAIRATGSSWQALARLQRTGMIEMEFRSPDADRGRLTRRVVTMVDGPMPLVRRDELFRRTPAQRRIYEALESAGGRAEEKTLLATADAGSGPLRQMVERGILVFEQESASRDPFADVPSVPPPERLTGDQLRATESLSAAEPGTTMLLQGVTGSGKTAVYLEIIRRTMAEGRGAILLVPEIALTPQTVARVRGAFGDQVAVLHSALSDAERADAWRLLRSGERRVAVGARSAIFAPTERLGVIIIDEEHEASYKNGETPRYHAREVAAMRARIEGAHVVLGSATPALESWLQARERNAVVHLPNRIGGIPMPPVEIIDLRSAPQVEHAGAVPWTEELDSAVQRSLAAKEQALLLLNRRGWAAFMQCSSCGSRAECPHCAVTLTVHSHPDHLRCHYCGWRDEIRGICAICDGATVRNRGTGTQQLERLVAERFPGARLARMDLDTTGARWAHHRILERVGRGEIDILLGTQMIAKGIDFPNVTLVGVVDADLSLAVPDFRSEERTFQLVAQVAGRAGRGPLGGRVLVQTRQPDHRALRYAAVHDTDGFLAEELEARRFPEWPPHISVARVVGSGEDQQELAAAMMKLADWSERAIARSKSSLLLRGPVQCPVPRIRGRWREHLIVKGRPAEVGAWVRTVGPRLGSSGELRFAVDRNPVSLL